MVRSGHWEEKDLLEILPLVDAIETFNARCMKASYNRQAQAFAQQYGILGTAGSDADVAYELGRATLLLPDFHDAESLRKALPQAKMETRLSSPLVHFTSRYGYGGRSWDGSRGRSHWREQARWGIRN